MTDDGSRESRVDLAAHRTGGRVLVANDEFFAPKENLLRAEPAVFVEGKYTEHGKWMDGWETRRRRTPGHDWCIVRLGLPGRISHVTVDTSHFRGNHPEAASLDACALEDRAAEDSLAVAGPWWPLVPKTPLAGHTANRLAVLEDRAGERATHVRLAIHPDGGVARLRVWGHVQPDWTAIGAAEEPIDLVAIEHGGRALASSDAFFSQPINLTMPGRGRDMGDGWETRRRRGPGHDWVVLALGHRGVIEEVVVDTRHFKGNYPDTCWLEGCDLARKIHQPSAAASYRPESTASKPDLAPQQTASMPASQDAGSSLYLQASTAPRDEVAAFSGLAPGVALPTGPDAWTPLVDATALEPHAEHRLVPRHASPVTHVRLSIAPDGGVSRLRLLGRPTP